MVIGRQGSLPDGELHTDLTLGTARRTGELVRSDSGQIVRVGQVLQWDPESADQGFGGLGGFGVEDFEGEEGVLERRAQRESEALVPHGSGGAGVVGFGGEAAIRVDPEHCVGLELAVLPVDVLEVLGGDDREVQIERLQ